MNEEQREVAERLGADQSSSNLEWSRQVVALLRELLAEPQGEPVAWLVMDESGYVQHAASWRDAAHEHINDAINEYDLVCARTWRVVPVYAAPQQQVPLTDEQIAEMLVQEQFLLVCDGIEELTEIVRAIERAHGITGEPT